MAWGCYRELEIYDMIWIIADSNIQNDEIRLAGMGNGKRTARAGILCALVKSSISSLQISRYRACGIRRVCAPKVQPREYQEIDERPGSALITPIPFEPCQRHYMSATRDGQ